MTFASLLFVWIAVAGALATVALHLLAWRRPPETPLPTARFVPDAPVRTVSRAVRPADLALLVLRVTMLLLVGGALAGPTFGSKAGGVARVIVMDRSRVSAGIPAISDSARPMFRAGDVLVVFDSVAREVRNATSDSLGISAASSNAGSLSAALIVAIRAARRLQRQHDSVEIVVVSPFASEEVDAATRAIRRTWPGIVRPIRAGTRAPNDPMVAGRLAVRAPSGDAVAAALALAGDLRLGDSVRVIRDEVTAADSAWARAGHALVQWPSATAPTGWQRHPTIDTAFAVIAVDGNPDDSGIGPGAATVVAPFPRVVIPPVGRTIARWQDGEPAVTETALGNGCLRSVAIPVSGPGDVALSPAFRRFAGRMVEHCGGSRSWVAAPDSMLDSVLSLAADARGAGRESVDGTANPPSRLAAALLALAVLAAVAELVLRRGSMHATA